jgi:hypothetical protein
VNIDAGGKAKTKTSLAGGGSGVYVSHMFNLPAASGDAGGGGGGGGSSIRNTACKERCRQRRFYGEVVETDLDRRSKVHRVLWEDGDVSWETEAFVFKQCCDRPEARPEAELSLTQLTASPVCKPALESTEEDDETHRPSEERGAPVSAPVHAVPHLPEVDQLDASGGDALLPLRGPEEHANAQAMHNVQDLIDERQDALMRQEAVNSEVRCCICQYPMSHAASLSTCSHRFCEGCIRRALRVHSRCPLCNKPARPRDVLEDHMMRNIIRIMKISA